MQFVDTFRDWRDCVLVQHGYAVFIFGYELKDRNAQRIARDFWVGCMMASFEMIATLD